MKSYERSARLSAWPTSLVATIATFVLLHGCGAENEMNLDPGRSLRAGGTQGGARAGGSGGRGGDHGGQAADAGLGGPVDAAAAASTDAGDGPGANGDLGGSVDVGDALSAEGSGTAGARTKECNGHMITCPMGTYVDCRFLHHCLPVGGSCPIPGAPELSKACDGHGAVGPSCVRPDEACETRRVCPDDRKVYACKAGMVFSCGLKKCLPITKGCVDADRRFPVGCKAPEDFTVCVAPDIDCKTVKKCGDEWQYCRSGETFDCNAGQCVPAGKTCTDPLAPQLCPGRGGGPPFCAAKDAECATAKKCSDGAIVACRKDQVVDCDVPNSCAPKEGKCLDDVNSKYCPGKGGAGPDCWPEDVDCNTVTVCSFARVAACPAGQRFDCARESCQPN